MAASTPGRSGRVDAWVHVCRALFADGGRASDGDRPGDDE